jgi:hypothetical protein
MDPIKLGCVAGLCLGIIFIPLSFVVKKKFPKLNWATFLAAGITGMVIGVGGLCFGKYFGLPH